MIQELDTLIDNQNEQSAARLHNVLSKKSQEELDLIALSVRTELRKEAEKSFFSFFKQSWKIIWPNIKYIDSWFFKYMCEELQKLAEDNITGKERSHHLNINILPGTGKTTCVSIAFPVWIWIKNPSKRFITTSYSPKLAEDNNSKSIDLIKSDWFQANWGHLFRLTKTLATECRNDKSGYRMTTSPGSLIGTGYHADFIIGDDNQNAEQVYSKVYRGTVQRWGNETIASRLVDKLKSVMINIQQRLHGDDMTAYIRKNQPELYKFVVLPGEDSTLVEPAELKKFYTDGFLCPKRFPKPVLDIMRTQFRNAYSGQVEQNPIAEGGNLFKEAWARWYTKEQVPAFERIVVSADTANTGLETSCPVSIQVWGERRPNFYLLYDETLPMTIEATKIRISAIGNIYPGCVFLVEMAASGFSIFEYLQARYPQVFPFNPAKFGGKEQRALSITDLWEAGNIFLPEIPYMHTYYLPEIVIFPNGEFKDRVDAMSQALIFMTRGERAARRVAA